MHGSYNQLLVGAKLRGMYADIGSRRGVHAAAVGRIDASWMIGAILKCLLCIPTKGSLYTDQYNVGSLDIPKRGKHERTVIRE